MKTRVLMITALLVGCLAGTAQATTTAAKNVPSEVVSYADLDIANHADAEILLQRVKAAAFRVCVRSGVLVWLDSHNPVQQCAKAATARAMADVNSRSTTAAIVSL
ncbi:MAG TPA: UrcA family protein [Steroidobacteraceae bacterium]|jgi:UrcA family protein|nr:UrcA family protein [Steroidobacteraceae bacterium]